MVRIFIAITFLFLMLYASGQSEVSVYSESEKLSDVKRINKACQVNKIGDLSLSKLNSVVSELVYNGDEIRDSIAKLRIYQSYFWSQRDLVNGLKTPINLLTRYSDKLTKEENSLAQMKVGQSYYSIKNYKLALIFYKKAESNLPLFEKKNFFTNCGLAYSKLKKYNQALTYFEKAREISENEKALVGTLNSLGFIKFLNNDFDGALISYNQALKVFSENHTEIDSLQFAILQSNIASLELESWSLDKGKKRLLNIVHSNYFNTINKFQKKEIFVKCVTSFLLSDDRQNAKKYLAFYGELLELDQKKPSSDRLLYFELKVKCHNICNESNLSKLAFTKYLSELNNLNEQELELSNSAAIITKTLFENQLQLVDNNLTLERESQKELEVSNTKLIMLFVTLSSLLLFWVLQKRKNQRKNTALLKYKTQLLLEKKTSLNLEKRILKKDMDNRKLELIQFLNEIQNSSSLSDEVSNRLKQMKGKGAEVQEDISQLVQFINSRKRNDRLSQLIEEKSDIISLGFRERVKLNYNSLSKSEIQLLILIKLGLSTKEIAQFKNVEVTSIRTLRHRLKVKMNVPKEIVFSDFIKNIE